MKKIILCIVMGVCFVANIFCDEQNENLKIANQYYDAENYENAKEYFLKTIDSGTYNGTIFYRLGYCIENINNSDSLMKKCYEASYYCFKKDSDINNPYFKKAENKVKQYGLKSEITETDLNNIISMAKPSIMSMFWDFVGSFWFILLAIGILIYIGAYKLSKNTNCVIVYGWKDFIVIALGVFFIFVLRNYIREDISTLFIPMGFFSISIIFSLIGNIRGSAKDGIFYVILYTLASIITKIILLVVIPVIIIYGYFVANSGKEDKRYKDGTKNNDRTANIGLFSAIVSSLFMPLMKTKEGRRVKPAAEQPIVRWTTALGRFRK